MIVQKFKENNFCTDFDNHDIHVRNRRKRDKNLVWKIKFWNQWNIHYKRGNCHNKEKTFDDSDHFDTWHLGIVLIIVSSDLNGKNIVRCYRIHDM